MMELKEFVTGFSEQFEDNDRDKISVDTRFKDLDGWDSLTTMLVIGFIKSDCNKDITGAELNDCDTVHSIYDFLYN